MHITPAQCRAARSLLNWSQEQLAERAMVSRATVADFESSTRQPMTNNLRAITGCLVSAGVEFVGEDGEMGVGVRFGQRRVTYLKAVKIDRDRNLVAIPMRYAGTAFACEVGLDALTDFLLADLDTDEDIAGAVSEMFDHIYAVAQRYAASDIRDGVLAVDIDMLNIT